jgi:HD-GYP domain-containing protein (c-di-GMP phosphodiesterase class II)
MSARRIRVELVAPTELRRRVEAVLGEGFELGGEQSETPDARIVSEPERRERAGAARALRGRDEIPTVALLPQDASTRAVRECFRQGAADVLFTEELESALACALQRCVERARAREGQDAPTTSTATGLGSRGRRLADALERLRSAYDETLAALVAALDSRERETACHSQRVAAFAALLGVRTGIVGEGLENLYRGALLHDIGKIGIPDAILLKRGELEPEEWEVMRRHPEIGAGLLEGISFLRGAIEVPLTHHEAWDGSGYPRGLRREEIPVASRIFAVVDTYDALRSERPYKAAMSHADSLEVLCRVSRTRLDPVLVERFGAEPEASWRRLAESASRSSTFRRVLHVCREEIGG